MTEAPPRAASALVLGGSLAAGVVALAPPPPHWLEAEHALAATATERTPLVDVWLGLARGLPIGGLPERLDLVAALLVVLTAVAAARLGWALFRGAGRRVAAITAAPITAIALSRWVLEVGSARAVSGLAIATLSTLALGAVVASRVHDGRIAPGTAIRALAATSAIALIDVAAALPLVAMTIAMTLATSFAQSKQSGGATPWRTWVRVAALGLAPTAIALGVLALLRGPLVGPSLATTAIGWPDASLLSAPPVAALVYPAVALLLLMLVVLRWRGGPWLAAWAIVPLLIRDDDGPWIPVSVVLVVIAVAASGWVWLAGLMQPRRAWLGATAAVLAAAGLTTLAMTRGPDFDASARGPVADARPRSSLVSVYGRGLLAPGDVIVVHDEWLAESLRDRRTVEGWRPDVAIVSAATLTEAELAQLSLDWGGTGRRIVSDSFDLAARWNAEWAVDSGPLFWFVGAHDPADREFTDLSGLFPEPEARSPAMMRRWHRLAIERARFRRAVGDPQAALAALPLDSRRHRSLLTRLQLARSARTEAAAGSELPAPIADASPDGPPDEALVLAEAGDLLFSHGEQERASELLIASANAGYAPAWGALARWQLRAGATSAAKATLSAIAGEPSLRGQALDVLRWLLSRDRLSDAQELVTVLGPPPSAPRIEDAALEAAARLRLLDALTQGPKHTPPKDEPSLSRTSVPKPDP